MRKLLVVLLSLLVLCLCTGALADVAIDEAHFPDAAFRTYLSASVDQDQNAILSDEEIANTTYIGVTD